MIVIAKGPWRATYKDGKWASPDFGPEAIKDLQRRTDELIREGGYWPHPDSPAIRVAAALNLPIVEADPPFPGPDEASDPAVDY